MSPEEFERLKEAEKAHLRKLKELKAAVRAQQRGQRVADALGRVVEGRRTTIEDHDDAVERLAYETARAEARVEIALQARHDDAPTPEASEEELERERARALIRQMKADLADSPPAPSSSEDDERPGGASPFPDEGLPDKTIGRMRRD